MSKWQNITKTSHLTYHNLISKIFQHFSCTVNAVFNITYYCNATVLKLWLRSQHSNSFYFYFCRNYNLILKHSQMFQISQLWFCVMTSQPAFSFRVDAMWQSIFKTNTFSNVSCEIIKFVLKKKWSNSTFFSKFYSIFFL